MKPYNSFPVVINNAYGAEIARRDFYPPIRCTVTPPGGHCWYCKQAANDQPRAKQRKTRGNAMKRDGG